MIPELCIYKLRHTHMHTHMHVYVRIIVKNQRPFEEWEGDRMSWIGEGEDENDINTVLVYEIIKMNKLENTTSEEMVHSGKMFAVQVQIPKFDNQATIHTPEEVKYRGKELWGKHGSP